MENTYRDFLTTIEVQLAGLLATYSAREMEEVLFEVFTEASKEPGVTETDIDKRITIHSALRSCLRTLDQNKEFTIKMIKNK